MCVCVCLEERHRNKCLNSNCRKLPVASAAATAAVVVCIVAAVVALVVIAFIAEAYAVTNAMLLVAASLLTLLSAVDKRLMRLTFSGS